MSRTLSQFPPSAAELYAGAPYVGALLRMANNVSRERSLRVLKERAFDDLNLALLSGFYWPPADGVRPIDLAKSANMTRQAMNRLIRELEGLGYMERRAEKPGGRRLVYLTRRGWQVFESIWTAQKQLQEEWTAVLGKERFDEFMRTLRQVSMADTRTVQMKKGTAPDREDVSAGPPRTRKRSA